MGRRALTRRSAAADRVVCVLGDMDLVRPLALAGLRCVVHAPPTAISRHSRQVAASLDWVDHWQRPEALAEHLLAFARTRPSPPALFYQSTADLLMVSRHRARLGEGFRFVAAGAELVEALTDKATFQALAERLGLPVPATRHLRPAEDPGGWRTDLRAPLLVKPVVRRFGEWGQIAPTAKALELADEAALRALWPRLAAAGCEVLVQELIPGPESSIESHHVYVDERGELVADFTGRKIRTRPTRFGYTTALTLTDAADVAAAGREAVGRLGLTGVAKLDFKRAPDGRLALLEVNPRFTLWHHPAAVAGLNIPALVWADLHGEPRPPVRRARPGVRWCDPWQDAAAARESGELGLRWLHWAATCEAVSGFAWDDPAPFLRGVALPRLARHLRTGAARVAAAGRA